MRFIRAEGDRQPVRDSSASQTERHLAVSRGKEKNNRQNCIFLAGRLERLGIEQQRSDKGLPVKPTRLV